MQTEQQSLRAAAGQRFWQIDALRGLALLNMLVYHAMYDWVYIFGHASGWYDIWSTHCHVWQQYICWSFILLSGYSFTLSRRPLKNGLLTAACAVVLTVATAVAMPEEVIWFGVLHLLGCAALLTCLLHPALEKLPPLAGVTGSAVLFALLNQLPQGWLGFEGTHLAALPAAWYKPNLFWLGLPDLTVFSSSDYFPLLPWVFLYWVGYFFARPDKVRFEEILLDLAKQYGVQMPSDQLFIKGEAFAIRAGGRSPRVARQFIELLSAGVRL